MYRIFLLFIFGLAPLLVFGQSRTITGTVSDNEGAPLIGATVVIKGTTTGTVTGVDGSYSLTASTGNVLVFSFIGYQTKEVTVAQSNVIDVSLSGSDQELSEVAVVGSRNTARSSTDTPLPVDVISNQELVSTGQNSFDKTLQYRIPSFNTVQTPVNDATSLLDPYEIRNLGPSRTLILINGKRKNLSALLYTQTSPGRGETGADLAAIPTDAIKRIEILRDGASAQYGSDAIAGVVNVVLKDQVDQGSIIFRGGITGEGDGEEMNLVLNDGVAFGNKKQGFFNYTLDFRKRLLASRSGTVSAEGEYRAFRKLDPDNFKNYLNGDGQLNNSGPDLSGKKATDADVIAAFNNYKSSSDYTTKLGQINTSNDQAQKDIADFLAKKPDAGNINGSPETTQASFLVNAGYDLSEFTSLYFNAAYVYKKVNSFANYRTPYWRTAKPYYNTSGQPFLADLLSPANPAAYDGYVPTFDGDLDDYNATFGFKSTRNGWNTDLSITFGGNRQTYTIRNSVNRGLEDNRLAATKFNTDNKTAIDSARSFNKIWASKIASGDTLPRVDISKEVRERSPITFRAGGTDFKHIVGNIDVSKAISNVFSIAFGSEFRSETFETIEGDVLSYEFGGPDSFAGNDQANSFINNRYNIGAYLDLSFDFTEDFLVNATVRGEDYSDFGETVVYKLSTRYKFLDDKISLRGSYSTGFRAPTLHQIYTQKAQYTFSGAAGGIAVEGLLNNLSSEANSLGVPKLGPEKSTNLTLGLGLKLSENFSATFDYYSINIEDRILLGNEVGPTGDATKTLDRILTAGNISKLSFFSNGLDTKTSGIDFVLNYKNINLGTGVLSANLSGNYTLTNERDGNIKNPKIIQEANKTILTKTQEALMFTSRPQFKVILGLDYKINKFNFGLYNTVFGPTIFRQADLGSDNNDPTKDNVNNIQTKFKTKVVTDLSINYQASEKVNITLFINNVLGVLPERVFEALNTNGENTLKDAAKVKVIDDDITFNQRYPVMTYDGYHFSQLGRLFNLAVNVKI